MVVGTLSTAITWILWLQCQHFYWSRFFKFIRKVMCITSCLVIDQSERLEPPLASRQQYFLIHDKLIDHEYWSRVSDSISHGNIWYSLLFIMDSCSLFSVFIVLRYLLPQPALVCFNVPFYISIPFLFSCNLKAVCCTVFKSSFIYCSKLSIVVTL